MNGAGNFNDGAVSHVKGYLARRIVTLAQIQYSAKSEIFVFLTLAQIQYSAKSEIFVFLTLAQIQYSAKSEIFVFPETSDKFSRSHV
ncbi:hypothetical protein EKP31_23065, partial [Salmonella enterica]|nr:hypothetical protein [Salmonella enterica]